MYTGRIADKQFSSPLRLKLRHGAFGDKSKSSSNKEASPDEPDKREETKQKNEAKARRNREKKRVQEVEDAKKKKEKALLESDEFPVELIDKMTVPILLGKRKLSKAGVKADLVARLQESCAASASPATGGENDDGERTELPAADGRDDDGDNNDSRPREIDDGGGGDGNDGAGPMKRRRLSSSSNQ